MDWTRAALTAAALTCLAALSACGGGSDSVSAGTTSSSSSSSSSSGGSSNTSLALGSNQVSVTASIGAAAPATSVQIIITNFPPSDEVYVEGKYTANGISGATPDSSTEAVDISFKSPATLGVGVYHDTVTIEACYDQACTSQVLNSPQIIDVQYTVTAGPAPAPTLSALSPSSATAGAAAFSMTLSGANFTASSQVLWNAAALSTTFVSSTQLTALVPAADIAAAGNAAVTVLNPGSPATSSNPLSFTIQAGPPSLSSVSPAKVTAGGGAFMLTVLGANFSAASAVQWNGSARTTSFVSSNELIAQIMATDIAAVGSAAVTVVDPALPAGTAPVAVSIQAPSIDAVAFQINASHSGTINFASASLPTASAWSVTLDGPPSYALIAAGKVYVTVSIANNSELVALDQSTGATVWGPIVISGPANAAYDADTVFVVSGIAGNPGLMQAFDAATGQSTWSTALTGQYGFSSGPTAADGFVYTDGAGSGGTLYAINESNGATAWTQEVNNGDDSTPAITADGVYVAFPCWIYDFRPATGETIWFQDTGCDGGGGGTTLVANGVLYAPTGAGTNNGETLTAENGSVLGSYVSDNVPAIGATMGFFLQSGTLRGINLSSNFVIWSFAGDGNLTTSPILVNQYVFIGSTSGNLYALDASTGQQLWSTNLGAALPQGARYDTSIPLSGLSAGDGLLLVPAGNTLTAFTLSTHP